jgi:hypothetical protein
VAGTISTPSPHLHCGMNAKSNISVVDAADLDLSKIVLV